MEEPPDEAGTDEHILPARMRPATDVSTAVFDVVSRIPYLYQ